MKARLYDSFNLLSKLDLRKLSNLLKLISTYYYSKWTGKIIYNAQPFTVSIEPTTACNLACPECPSGQKIFTRPTGKMTLDEFKINIEKISRKLIYCIFYFQGEPYLNPELLEMIKFATDKRIYTITSTNAHFIDDEIAKKTIESGLDRMIISLDGTTQEVYELYRINGEIQKVLAGAEKLVKWKKELKSKTPYLIFQFLVVGPNEHQIEEVKDLAQKIGIDEVKFKSAQIYNFENGSDLIPKNEKYSRYKKQKDGKYQIKNKLNNHCWKMWHSNVITWDARIVPCCFDKDAKYQMGDLSKNPYMDIMNNEKYKDFREKLSTDRKEIDICKNCTEGGKVWLL